MAIDAKAQTTRRALLGAGLGAIAATAAGAIAGSAVADATSPPVLLGDLNDALTSTIVRNGGKDTAAVALYGRVTHATGSPASAGVRGQDDGTNGTGVSGIANTGSTARGVYGQSTGGHAVEGASSTGLGVLGSSSSGKGVQGNSNTGAGVQGVSVSGPGVKGIGTSGYGISGESPAGGVYGHSSIGVGVAGYTSSSDQHVAGVYGQHPSWGYGVHGVAGPGGYGVYGSLTDWGTAIAAVANGGDSNGVTSTAYGINSTAVWGSATGSNSIGIHGSAGNGTTQAGYFSGDVTVTGTLTTPTSMLQLDHPGAPAQRYYQQALVGSFERVSIISGNAITGPDGTVAVAVPPLFVTYHADVRYQLTPLGRAKELYVGRLLDARGRFIIASDQPGLHVSWQLTGVRTDPAALKQPLRVDVAKPARYRGRYIQPAVYGQPRSKSLVAPRPLPPHRGPARHPKAG